MSGPVQRHLWVKVTTRVELILIIVWSFMKLLCHLQVEAENIAGKQFKKKFTGVTARIFSHEFDHLNGVCYIDHLDAASKKAVEPVLTNLVDSFGSGGAL
jgi:hypothetical protein